LKLSQLDFWAVNMGNIPQYDPIKETEYMVKEKLDEAEKDGTLKYLASTYSIQSDRLSPGIGADGARVLTFAPLLVLNQIPLNSLIKALLDLCEEALNYEVEIEFAMTIDPKSCSPARFGFLQVRPMVVSSEQVEVSESDLHHPNTLVASTSTLGNGESHDIHDIVFVRPDNFEAKFTPSIAQELEHFNGKLRREGRHYLLIGLGRWGSSDPWLGIPVNWSQISGAKVMVEATLPTMNVDFSQGSHFFHNLTSFQVSYFFVHHNSNFKIGWDWLEQQTVIEETHLVRHVRLSQPLQVKVDGRSGKGVIHHG